MAVWIFILTRRFLEELVLALYDDRGHVGSAGVPQLVHGDRHVLRDLEEDVVRHHIANRLIFDARDVVSPLE